MRTLKSHDSQVTLWCPIWNTSARRVGVERQPDLDTSGNRCTKPDPRYPTRLSAKVLISRITVYSILTVPFLLSSESFCRINQIGYNSEHIPLDKAENIEEILSNPHWVNPTRTQSQLANLIQDPTQYFSVCSTPSAGSLSNGCQGRAAGRRVTFTLFLTSFSMENVDLYGLKVFWP